MVFSRSHAPKNHDLSYTLYMIIVDEQPSADLISRILVRIAFEKKKRQRMRVLSYLGVSFICFIGLGVMFPFSISEIGESEFFTFLSLVVSDPDILLSDGRMYLSILTETFPIASILSLSFAFLAMFGIRHMVGNAMETKYKV